MDADNMETGPDAGKPETETLTGRPVVTAPPTVKAPLTGQARLTYLNKRFAALTAEKELALLEQRIADLEAERKSGFAPRGLRKASESLDKDALALERATDIRALKFYTGKGQCELDAFVHDVEATFRTRPLTYASEEKKCVYAGKYIDEQPSDDWAPMDKRIGEDPAASYSFKGMIAMFQEKLVPKHIRQVVTMAIKALHQLPNQTVGELIAHPSSLEQQRATDKLLHRTFMPTNNVLGLSTCSSDHSS